jgi:carbon-monoxide dehydrogenase medium subunit
MLLAEVEYARPETVDEAVRLLSARDDSRVLAGGQSLLNVMKTRVASPEVLVDIGRISDLRAIGRTEHGLELGAGTTYSDLVRSDDIRAVRPILADVAIRIADVQVRNRGTLGGNICSNDPTNHFPPVLAAIGASMTIRGLGGERTVTADEFFEGVFMTAVTPGELLTRIAVPALADGEGDGFASVTIGKDGTGIVNVACTVAGGNARVAIGCVAATPVVLTAAADEVTVRDAVESAGLDPPSDVHASAEYRRHVAAVCAVRALREALG